MTDKPTMDLEQLSKGIINPDNPEMMLMMEKNKWNDYPTQNPRKIYAFRRNLRRSLFKIRKYMVRNEVEKLDVSHRALMEIFDVQMNPNLAIDWNGFTFKWDVHPVKLTHLILKEQWFAEGGSVDEIGNKAPTAFTKQEF